MARKPRGLPTTEQEVGSDIPAAADQQEETSLATGKDRHIELEDEPSVQLHGPNEGPDALTAPAPVQVPGALTRELEKAEADWNAWESQRDAIVKTLTSVRQRATALLARITGQSATPAATTGVRPARRGRPPGSGRKRGRPAKAARAALGPMGVKRGPGRPPGSGTKKTATKAAKKVGRRKFTPEQRAEAAERMKAYWAERRKA
jgi:hypothetical protein